MDATLVTHELDLRKLGAFLAPGHKEPPTTSFNIRVHASGTRRAPLVDLELRGRGSQVDEGLPENVDYRVRAHYGGGRVDGEVSARQLGTKLGIGARFDLPLSFAQSDDRPLSLDLEARPVPFFKIRDSLPPAIAGLRGFFTLRVRASGTTRHPIFTAELHAPSWDLDDLANNDTILDVTYDGTLLRANSVTSFAATSFIASLLRIRPKRNAGTIKLELKAPVDLARLLARPRQALTALVHTAQLSATAEIKGVELQSVPLQVIGVAAPFTSGLVDGAVSMSGTLDAPSLHARLRATGMGRPGLVDHVDGEASFAFEGSRAQLSGTFAVANHPLVAFKGETVIDAQRLFDGESWKQGALRGGLEFPRFDLSVLSRMEPRLRRLSGVAWGKGTLRGTLAQPELSVELDASPLALGGDRFDRTHVSARYGGRQFAVQVTAAQADGGSFAGEASWSRTADPLAISLRAHALDIGFLASASEEVSALDGTLDAELTIDGTAAAPRPAGFLAIHRASLGLRGKSEKYRDGELDLRTAGGRARLTLDVHTRDGSLHASGDARIDGVQPTRLALDAHAEHFALVYGSFAAKLDADFGLVGDRASGEWTGRVDLRRGTINLPDLSGAAEVQPLGEMVDVDFADGRAEKLKQPKAGKGHWIAARIVGPLEIRGHEANLDLQTDLALTIVPGKTSATGVVRGEKGTVELFGKAYRLDEAEVRFDGAVDNPALHLRATRKTGNATLIVTVSGTALDPKVALAVDPPVYDQAHLVGLMLAGSTRGSTAVVSFRQLNRQIGGLLSNVILSKIKEQMAAVLPTETFEPVDNESTRRFALSPLEVGRYVSDRVYVSYEHQFGASLGRSAANANESQVKLRLPHGGELDTAVGDAGVAGVYLYWTYRY
jgi:autotransporter translocation and assembly factor TamB